MRYLKFMYVIFSIFILLTAACYKKIYRKKFTGLYTSESCYQQITAITEPVILQTKKDEYQSIGRICLNGILLVFYGDRDIYLGTNIPSRFLNLYINSTNALIQGELDDCMVDGDELKTLTNYYLLKGLKNLAFTKKIVINNDFIHLTDMVCYEDSKNIESMTRIFPNNLFAIVFEKRQIRNNHILLHIDYKLHI